MKRVVIFLLVLAILAGIAYFSMGIVLPGYLIVIEKRDGRILTFDRPGIYLNIPFIERHRVYRRKLNPLKVGTSLQHKGNNYKINLLLLPEVNEPSKIFPEKKNILLKKVILFYRKGFSLPVTFFIKNPPVPKIPGLSFRVFIRGIIPDAVTMKKQKAEITSMIKELLESEKESAAAEVKKIMKEADEERKSIISRAENEKKNLIQSAISLEGNEVANVKAPELWFLLKKLEIYSSLGTDVTLYLKLPQETLKGGR